MASHLYSVEGSICASGLCVGNLPVLSLSRNMYQDECATVQLCTGTWMHMLLCCKANFGGSVSQRTALKGTSVHSIKGNWLVVLITEAHDRENVSLKHLCKSTPRGNKLKI